MSDRSAGCRGVIGPVPRPLWMNTAQPRGELRHGASQSRIVGTTAKTSFPRFRSGSGRERHENRHSDVVADHLPLVAQISTARIETVKPGWPTTGWQWVRFVGNFANLSTPLGLAVAGMGGATIKRGPRGLFLGEGYRFSFPVAGAFTVGSVITTGSTWEEMLSRNPSLIKHEEAHTWQYLYCLGLPYYIPYGSSWAGRCCVRVTEQHGTSSSARQD